MSSTFTRGRSYHARIYEVVCGWQERGGLLEWRKALVGDLSGEVVELGAGTGRNLPFYPAEVRVFASDRDPVMLERAVPRARDARAEVKLFLADAQRLPFADRSVDTIVIGLMLCSVPDFDQTISEVRRILKPTGHVRFVEHIRDPKDGLLGRSQDLINPVWRTISGGCNMNRRSDQWVEGAGFSIRRRDLFKAGAVPLLAPHVMVEATPSQAR
jgi:ubiquinone/menaquinone biosynthesis C-methylase UbiE